MGNGGSTHFLRLEEGKPASAPGADKITLLGQKRGERRSMKAKRLSKHAPAKRLQEKTAAGDFDVFLAHNSEDKKEVLAIADQLKQRGIYPWVDAEQSLPAAGFRTSSRR